MTQTAPFDWTKVVDCARREQVENPKTQYELPGVTIEGHLMWPGANYCNALSTKATPLRMSPDPEKGRR